jgi:hypothetical protein
MKRSFVVKAVVVLSWAALAAAPLRADTKQSVREILKARHFIAMSADDWRKLGDDVDTQLLEAAADGSLTYGARQRAISGLSVLGGPRERQFLRDTIERAQVAPELLSSAVQAYARAFAKTEPADVRRLTMPLLDHQDWTVRQGAVRALGEVGAKDAYDALRLRQGRETHPAVQDALRTALRRWADKP